MWPHICYFSCCTTSTWFLLYMLRILVVHVIDFALCCLFHLWIGCFQCLGHWSLQDGTIGHCWLCSLPLGHVHNNGFFILVVHDYSPVKLVSFKVSETVGFTFSHCPCRLSGQILHGILLSILCLLSSSISSGISSRSVLVLFFVLFFLVTFLHLTSSLEFRDNSHEELDTEGLKIALYPAVRSADVTFSLDAPDASWFFWLLTFSISSWLEIGSHFKPLYFHHCFLYLKIL